MARAESNGTKTRATNAVVASAKRIPLDNRKLAKLSASKRADWQDEGWDYFDDVPEIKYSTWFLGNAMAKLRIFAAVRDPDDPEADPIPVSDPASGISPDLARRAQMEIERLKSPLGGTPEILRELNMNLEIAAECYLVGVGPRVEMVDDPTTPGAQVEVITGESWDIRSISEVKQKDGKYKIEGEPGDKQAVTLNPESDEIIRIWQRHPRWSNLPDCAMRGVLSECEALLLLSNQVKAEAKSHQSAGILAVPNELSFGPVHSTTPENDDDAVEDPFLAALADALIDPIEDPSSASAVMPLVVRGPADAISADKFRHIKLDRDTATNVLEERISQRVQRIARGLNLPVEVVLGHQGTTFANAAQVDEDTFDDHLEPRCVLIVDALTVGFLLPNLHAGLAGDPQQIDRIIVWYDASALIKTTDPDTSADYALENNLISSDAWRRVRGWTDDDAPDPLELLIKAGLRRGILTADLTKALLELLGVDIEVEDSADAPDPNATEGEATSEAARQLVETALLMKAARDRKAVTAAAGLPTERAAARNPGRDLMDLDRDLRSRIQVAASRAMDRALERAGNRLKAKAGATKSLVRTVHPVYAVATLGPSLVAQAGFTDIDLIGDDSWDELGRQYSAWVGDAQSRALAIAGDLATFTDAEISTLATRQAQDLVDGWTFFRAEMTTLAHRLLYSPDPHAVTAAGEIDPSLRVPAGLVRWANAIAGGATGLDYTEAGQIYVALNNGQPLGGIGTGELISESLKAADVGVEAYEWVYGPAFRANPFPEHEALDGLVFSSFDGDELAHGAKADWLPSTSYFPGDHEGCACDVAPVWVTND